MYPTGGESVGPNAKGNEMAPMVSVGGVVGPVKDTGKLATATTPSMVKLMVVEPPS